ncbi:hypothetical protein V6N11_060556 [Hibiscus sabdariffa]|uniref:Uncharacterized protein n=1 Tax=Hibiscus sabdariffa TaxID=183260 RepID=A0ABR2QQP4_9ROSI
MSGSPTLAHESAMTIEVINPGGRPPDGLPNITGDTIRERATSPFDLDSLRSSKKGCLNSVDLMESNNSTIEANEGIPQVGVEPGVALHGEAVKDSYASKLSGKQSKDGANHCFLKDEVLIRKEDIIEDCHGKIPSIQFSDRVHDQIDNNLRNAIIVRLLGHAIALQVWNELVQPVNLDSFLTMELSEWLRVNLSMSGAFARVMEHWNLVFGYTLWNLWLRRNVIVFNDLSAAQGNVIERARLLVTYTISSSGLARASPVTGARLMAEFDCWMPPEVH